MMSYPESELRTSLPEALIPADEPQRLVALKRYHMLDTPPEPIFDRITRLAAAGFGMPISLVSLVDETRQWFKSRHGLDAPWTRREIAFCGHTILETQTMVVLDAAVDPRFATNPLVTGQPKIRFYAGAPLITPDGHALGTLCVIDRKPRPRFSARQRSYLRDLASLVMTEIEARSTTLALRREIIEHTETEQRLRWLLTEKETLLREVHHRVGNNLQVVDTLLMLEIRQPTISVESLRNLQQRVHALGLIHSKLMRSENLKKIDLREFVNGLCQTLSQIHAGQDADVSLKVAAETTGLFIDIDLAIPLGLLINELITCAYKRSFPPDQRAVVSISLDVLGDSEAQLVIADSGTETPDTPLHCTAIGERIVAQLIGHLGADMTTQRHEGTRTTLTFPYQSST